MGKEKLAIRLSKLNFPAKFQGKTLAEISKLLELKVLLLLKKSLPSIDSEALKKAFHRSNSFLRLDNRYLEQHTKYKSNLRSKSSNIQLFRNIDNFNSQVSVVEWHGVNQYVNSRLGPLKSLISTLKPDDNVILTNTSYEPILLQIDDAISIYQYNLPLSSYGKNIRIIHRRGGKKTLILSDFDSKAYLIHFGLLINSYRKKIIYNSKSTIILIRHVSRRAAISFLNLLVFINQFSILLMQS